MADFHGKNWSILGFYENKTLYGALFSIKTNQGFIFIEPNSLSRAEDLAAVNHVTQAARQSGVEDWVLKVGFKELRLEPKFLNHEL